jgi:4'-phosphopantetheinyl transferase
MTSASQTDFSVRTHTAPQYPRKLVPGTLPSIHLPNGSVDVWLGELVDADVADSGSQEAWEAFLAPDEQERARRFHFPADRRRFVYGRGVLRWLLGAYLEADPARIQFTYSSEGKPELKPAPASRQLHFNLSHSGTRVLLAFAWERRVGADVEQVRNDMELEQIAGRFFSLSEQNALRSLDEASRISAFFRCWTRKEAYVKATGKGLALPLSQFDVSLLPNQPAALLATRPEAREAERWVLHNLDVGSGYAAAVAVERGSPSADEPLARNPR